MLTPGWMTQKLLIDFGYKAELEKRSVQREKLETQWVQRESILPVVVADRLVDRLITQRQNKTQVFIH